MITTVPQFPEEDIPLILAAFYQHGQELTKNDDTENEIKINCRLARILIRDPLFRDGHLRLDYEVDYLKDGVAVDCDKGNYRFDFRITASSPHPEVIFIIEAKRLNIVSKTGKKTNAGEYVTEGMIRFTSKKYAQFMRNHAMLGYVFDSKIQDAIKSIEKVICKHKTELEMQSADLSQSTILHDVPIYSTKHRLPPDECEIFHVFLPVPTYELPSGAI